MYQDRLAILERKSDKFVQKFNEILDFTDHADKVFQTGGMHQKRTLVKLCFEGFTVQNQKTPPIFTFCEIVRNSLGAKRLGMVFFRNFEGIFEIQKQSAVGNAEVRRAKHGQNEILQTNLFSFAFSERLSVFLPQGTLSCFAIHLVFDCPKTNLKTIWTT